jgi:hypothetical protein
MQTVSKFIILLAIAMFSVSLGPVNAKSINTPDKNTDLSRLVVFEGFYDPA